MSVEVVLVDVESVAKTANGTPRHIIQFSARRLDGSDYTFSCRAPFPWSELDQKAYSAYAARCGANWSGAPVKDKKLKTTWPALIGSAFPTLFGEQWPAFTKWLMKSRPKKIVLVAHNGARWDFKMIKDEMDEAKLTWSSGDIHPEMCVLDSRYLLPPAAKDSMKLGTWYRRQFPEEYAKNAQSDDFKGAHTASADTLALGRVMVKEMLARESLRSVQLHPTLSNDQLWAAWDRDRSQYTALLQSHLLALKPCKSWSTITGQRELVAQRKAEALLLPVQQVCSWLLYSAIFLLYVACLLLRGSQRLIECVFRCWCSRPPQVKTREVLYQALKPPSKIPFQHFQLDWKQRHRHPVDLRTFPDPSSFTSKPIS